MNSYRDWSLNGVNGINIWLLAKHTGTADFPGSCKSGSAEVFLGAAAEMAHSAQQCPPPLMVHFRRFSALPSFADSVSSDVLLVPFVVAWFSTKSEGKCWSGDTDSETPTSPGSISSTWSTLTKSSSSSPELCKPLPYTDKRVPSAAVFRGRVPNAGFEASNFRPSQGRSKCRWSTLVRPPPLSGLTF